MGSRIENHFEKYHFNYIVPMTRGTAEAIKGIVEEPVFIVIKIRVSD